MIHIHCESLPVQYELLLTSPIQPRNCSSVWQAVAKQMLLPPVAVGGGDVDVAAAADVAAVATCSITALQTARP